MNEIIITNGVEMLERTAKPMGNGSHVIVPAKWLGKTIRVVRIGKDQEENI